ncbi:CvpA family protein [Pontiella sulfatireligans]|uniref:Colicin V production protein n=1 Tax=Pontiella sulfatireligans TaxID=2750658 RepID=A0A6C2UQZ9_9BACT|nr:CvpA family protein [Pontiella sulfatireligans]VGO21691.1 hypothetical protein SCARR_03765 [Pontiella sulfatireligans]
MLPDWVSYVDVGFAAVALLFAWSGWQKGFAGQVAHILTFVIMGGLLFFAYPAIFSYLGRALRNVNETYLMWLILGAMAALALAVFLVLSKMLQSLLKAQISDQSDKAYGFSLGLVRGILVALFAMVFLVILGPPRIYEGFSGQSKVGRMVCHDIVPRIQPHLTRAVLEGKAQQLRDKLMEQEEAGQLDET